VGLTSKAASGIRFIGAEAAAWCNRHKFMIIRNIKIDDADELLNIYSPYIKNSSITFETEIPGLAEFRNRVRTVASVYPWLAAEHEGRIAGYAYAYRHRERAAYRWSVDFTVYMRPEYHGHGTGSLLYSRLIGIVRQLGYYNAFAIITLPNEKSVRLHESSGFVNAGITRSAGYKLGRWHDVGYWQLKLREHDDSPSEPLTYNTFIQGQC